MNQAFDHPVIVKVGKIKSNGEGIEIIEQNT